MNKEDIKIADKSLFEGYVSFDDRKFNILLTIDNEKLLFQKKKGIFKKKLVTEKEIYIKDIKINKDKIGVRYNNDRVTILANSEVFKFTCSSEEDAMKIKEVLKKIIINSNRFRSCCPNIFSKTSKSPCCRPPPGYADSDGYRKNSQNSPTGLLSGDPSPKVRLLPPVLTTIPRHFPDTKQNL